MERRTFTIAEAAQVLGISRGKAYDLVRRGEFPVPVLDVPGVLLVPKEQLLRYIDSGGSPRRRASETPGTVLFFSAEPELTTISLETLLGRGA